MPFLIRAGGERARAARAAGGEGEGAGEAGGAGAGRVSEAGVGEKAEAVSETAELLLEAMNEGPLPSARSVRSGPPQVFDGVNVESLANALASGDVCSGGQGLSKHREINMLARVALRAKERSLWGDNRAGEAVGSAVEARERFEFVSWEFNSVVRKTQWAREDVMSARGSLSLERRIACAALTRAVEARERAELTSGCAETARARLYYESRRCAQAAFFFAAKRSESLRSGKNVVTLVDEANQLFKRVTGRLPGVCEGIDEIGERWRMAGNPAPILRRYMAECDELKGRLDIANNDRPCQGFLLRDAEDAVIVAEAASSAAAEVAEAAAVAAEVAEEAAAVAAEAAGEVEGVVADAERALVAAAAAEEVVEAALADASDASDAADVFAIVTEILAEVRRVIEVIADKKANSAKMAGTISELKEVKNDELLIRELEGVVARSTIEDGLTQGNLHIVIIERAIDVIWEVKGIVREIEESAAAAADRAAKAAAEAAEEVEADGWELI